MEAGAKETEAPDEKVKYNMAITRVAMGRIALMAR
jgi:hypothetical protein